MIKIIKSEEGYFTVESSLIVPFIIIISLSALIFSTVFYQNIINSLDYQRQMTDFTEYWPNYNKNIKTGYIPYNAITKKGLYSNFNFLDNYSDKKLKYLDSVMKNRKNPVELFNNYKVNAASNYSEIKLQDNFFSKELVITYNSPFLIPFGDNQEELLGDVSDPVEMIRNVDFISEMVKKVKSN